MPRARSLPGVAALCAVLLAAACDLDPGVPDELVAPELGRAGTLPPPTPQLLVDGLQGASGSTIGPDGALYVTQGATGVVSRVDPTTGAVNTFASGLPSSLIGIGGAVDVAFLDGTAYVLVTLVDDPLFPTGEVNGLYRIDGPNSFSIVADLGAYNSANPPSTSYFLETGVLYALETFRGDFLITDGHFNRVLRVTRDGGISPFKSFGNIVPTGLETHGHTVLMARAGPVPHVPAEGKVLAIDARSGAVNEVASGARLAVDVEFGLGQTLFVLSQGYWDPTIGQGDGTPADPGTGSLFRVEGDGSVTELVDQLNIPTSMELLGNTAYVVTLAGEIWKIADVSAPPHGVRH